MGVPVQCQSIAVPGGIIPGATFAAELTTDHPASSHGLPVVVDDRGNPYGPAECRVILLTPPETEEDAMLVEAANWCGFEIVPAGSEAPS